jgi:phospholipase/carboxylesterase
MSAKSGGARLRSRPGAAPAAGARLDPGVHELGLPSGDALAYVPLVDDGAKPSPVLVLFHGAGATAADALGLLLHDALDEPVVLAPTSAGRTWDEVAGNFGPDIATVDEALAWLFARHPVDGDRVAAGGFSDGASYALSVGLTNGDLFGHVIAFSPGFLPPGVRRGRPRVFVSHGRRDRILSFDRTRDVIVPSLTAAGLSVTFEEFDGGHEVPPEVWRHALRWFQVLP